MKRKFYWVLAVILAAWLSGCATSRSEIKVISPSATPPSTVKRVTKAQAVWMQSVVDERQFEAAPRDPSIPSLGFEGAIQASAETKARAFGRKRGGFGMALGDVLLEPGQTVSSVVLEQLSAAFADAGYRVVIHEADAGPNPLVVNVRIKQFWSWINMGFWALTLNNRINTDLVFSGALPAMTVNVHLQEQHLAITDGVWSEDLVKALQAYRSQALVQIGSLPQSP